MSSSNRNRKGKHPMFKLLLTFFITSATGSTAPADMALSNVQLPTPATVATAADCETYRKSVDASVSANPFTLPWGNKIVIRATGCVQG